jgi:hypothetical protein
MTHLKTLKAIVGNYIKRYRPAIESLLYFYEEKLSLKDAIHAASNAQHLNRNKEVKRHPHQYRIKKCALEQTYETLRKTRLGKYQSFDELHQKISDSIRPISGVGELMVYDTALRIGAFLKLEPVSVYLHAGTKTGAKALGLTVSGKKNINVTDLPKEFRKLKPHEIEDCLCIYKDNIDSLRHKTN